MSAAAWRMLLWQAVATRQRAHSKRTSRHAESGVAFAPFNAIGRMMVAGLGQRKGTRQLYALPDSRNGSFW